MGVQLGQLLEQSTAVLDALNQADLDHVHEDDLADAVMALQGCRARLEAAEAKVLARFDASRVWADSGAKTAAAWVSWKQRIPIQTARQRFKHARNLRDLPSVVYAWSAGEIDRTHVTTLLGARTPRTESVFVGTDPSCDDGESGHEVLLGNARSMSYSSFKRTCDRFEQVVDPDGAEQKAAADRASRSVTLAQSYKGMYYGRIVLDPVAGQIVEETLQEIEREMFEADWGEAKARLGRQPTTLELRRTSEQRRADATEEMAIRARTAPKDGQRPRPLFTVIVGLDVLKGPILELFNRTQITPGTAVPHLTDADVERIVFDTPSRVIDVGARRRFFRGALRRALEIRDRTCFHPSCDEIPQRPEADHIDPAANGGPTTQTNGRWGCGYHNRWRQTHPDQDDDEPH